MQRLWPIFILLPSQVFILSHCEVITPQNNLQACLPSSSEGPRGLWTNTSSPHFTSRFRQAKKWRKLAYDPDQEISRVQAAWKQRTNLWKYDKLIFYHFHAHVPKWRSRTTLAKITGKWLENEGYGEGREKFWKLPLIVHPSVLWL